MKYNNKIGMILTAGLALAAVSCTDKSDYNTAYEDALSSANMTLWENISSDPELTRYAALAKKAGYDSDFSKPGYHTLWLPTDQYITDSEYSELMAKDSAAIRKEFIQQHLIKYNNLVPATEQRIVSINDKHHVFSPEGFDDIPYVNTVSGQGINIPATNGVMHKIKGQASYHPNLYQFIDNLEGCDSIKNYLQQYDVTYVDTRLSVPGPIKDGVQTYTYTVWAKRNDVISGLIRAELENEDSTYCMLFPTDKAWNESYEMIKGRFNYLPKVAYKDLKTNATEAPNFTSSTSLASMKSSLNTAATAASKTTAAIDVAYLQDSITKMNIIENLAYSKSYDCNNVIFGAGGSLADTLYSTARSHISTIDSINKATIQTVTMSNGMSRVIDSYPFLAVESYEPMTGYSNVYPQKASKVITRNIAKSTLVDRMDLFSKVPDFLMKKILPEKSQYFSYVCVDSADIETTSSKIELDFALRNVLSTTYRILVVTVPRQVYEPLEPERPFNLRFFLSYTDADNKQQYTVLPAATDERAAKLTEANRYRQMFSTASGSSTTGTYYTGDPAKLNVIDLGEFTFPISYYGLSSLDKDNYAYPSLIMTMPVNFGTSTNRKKYDQFPRVAGVYLVPKAYYDSLQK